jgi:hypothetical protein
MRRIIIWTLVIGLLVVVIHDLAIYATAQRQLRAVTYDVTQWAGNGASSMSRDEAAQRVAQMASASGVTVYQYGQTDRMAQVWSSSEVKGTWVAGILVNMIAGKSFEEAKAAPAFTITAYREARFL